MLTFADALSLIATHAEHADQSLDWPHPAWEAMRSAGVLGWSIPAKFGGEGLETRDLLTGHERIARACLTTAFILSQQEAAIRQLLKGPLLLQERYLPALATGELHATVGLSQITTSRQHGGPALRATSTTTGYQIDGEIPWVTAADQAAIIVTGASLPDGNQILFILPTNYPGVRVAPPMPLAALAGSRTSEVVCNNVLVDHDLILAGPAAQVLGPVGGGGLETSNLALGVAVAATQLIEQESRTRVDLARIAARFRSATDAARTKLYQLVDTSDSTGTLAARIECTQLALRATQAALLTAKGAGFLVPHPAQRLARQSLFFLVWSCPRPVALGVLDDLQSALPEPEVDK